MDARYGSYSDEDDLEFQQMLFGIANQVNTQRNSKAEESEEESSVELSNEEGVQIDSPQAKQIRMYVHFENALARSKALYPQAHEFASCDGKKSRYLKLIKLIQNEQFDLTGNYDFTNDAIQFLQRITKQEHCQLVILSEASHHFIKALLEIHDIASYKAVIYSRDIYQTDVASVVRIVETQQAKFADYYYFIDSDSSHRINMINALSQAAPKDSNKQNDIEKFGFAKLDWQLIDKHMSMLSQSVTKSKHDFDLSKISLSESQKNISFFKQRPNHEDNFEEMIREAEDSSNLKVV